MVKLVPVTPTLDNLPFETLDWERYQTFCTDVLAQRMGIVDSREYLKQGNAQEGIDIYATQRGNEKKIVAQCKLEKYLSPNDVNELVNVFLRGDFVNETQEFILCTSFDLTKHRDEKITIENARKKLNEKDIELIVWDQKGLSGYLRTHPLPQTVYHFFKEDITKAFYGEIWHEYIDGLMQIPKVIYKLPEDHIQRTTIAYIEHQEKKNNKIWAFSEEKKTQSLINLFEEPVSERRIVLLSTAGFGKTQELTTLAAYYSRPETPIHPVRYFSKRL